MHSKKQFRTPKQSFRCLLALGMFVVANSIFIGSASAGLTITIDSTIDVGTSESISLFATGPDSVTDLNFVFVVEDGGEALGGSATDPPIIDVLGQGIFAGGTVGFSPTANPTNSPLGVIGGISVGSPVTPAAGGSPVATILFDTSSLNVGDTFELALAQGIQTTSFNNNDTPVSTEFADSCLLYTSPSPRDRQKSRMPSSA